MIPLRLNDYHVHSNPAAGSHDPSMMYDPVSGKYYSYCTDTYGPGIGVNDFVGIPVRSSRDLIHFQYETGTALSETAIRQGRQNGRFPETRNFWAPYCEYARGEYRLFYSATKAFGSSESRIWLAVSQSPTGPFENRGVVADTWGTDDTYPNAIDPHIIWEGERCWLVYGSFFGGIYIKELDPDTALPLDGDPKSLGKCIARKSSPPILDGPEGAAVCFVPETGYYYLFLSYGWLGDGYDIRVGRSKTVTGPYLDRKGLDLVEHTLGDKLAGSYRFCAAAPQVGTDDASWEWGGLRGPGHGVPFFDPVRKAWFFVHHIRDGAMCNSTRDPFENRLSFQRHYMMIRPMFFTPDGWPLLTPEPFGGESLTEPTVSNPGGHWEMLFFTDRNNGQVSSRILELPDNSPYLTNGRLHWAWDLENGGQVLTLTGADSQGNAYWGKRLS